MNPTDAQPAHQANNPLAAMQPGEQVICEIKRHPIGIFGIYAASGVLLVVLAILAFIVMPEIFTSANRQQLVIVDGLLFVLLSGLAIGFVFISNLIYWGNRWILTTDSLTQVTQTGLFHRQSSQLSLGSLEDVTAEKNGVLENALDFGMLRVETAGERSKFIFIYCPNPNYYARKILAAREVFEQSHHNQVAHHEFIPAPAYDNRPAPTAIYQPLPEQPSLQPQPAEQPIAYPETPGSAYPSTNYDDQSNPNY